jgi:hypothetical protein
MKSNTIIWRRLDSPGHEFVSLSFKNSKWNLEGTAVFLYKNSPCRIDYNIVCNTAWETLSSVVSGLVQNKKINCEISVDKRKQWKKNKKFCPEVSGCTDLDLNFSPSTNLLPIRRLKLSPGEKADVKAAWLRFPSFKLEMLEQTYYKVDKETYRYESNNGKFKREIRVNKSGMVTVYPDYWEVEAVNEPSQ